ncbi:MAG TPA: ABC transporter substrate-binding protein [Thermomicrobiaceae bacterium]|nr:ABC transporter substrate-binding protein [Thermomicrobiaceae bacterium]
MAEQGEATLRVRTYRRRTVLKSGLFLTGGALVGGSLLAACGQTPATATQAPASTSTASASGSGAQAATPATGGTTSGTSTAAASPAAQSAGQPKRGGTLQAAAEIDPVSLDPHTNANFSALQAYDFIYESLAGYDEKMAIIPVLATKWDISSDGKTYTFTLRQNVKFHNGQTMTGTDVKYSIDRVLNPKTASPWRSWLQPISQINVSDPNTVQLTLSSVYPGLLGAFAANRASAIIPNGLAEKENLKIQAVGTGPFKLVEYVPQDHISYTRNTAYWDPTLPYLDGMLFKVMTEENTRLAALQAGQIQYAAVSAQGAQQLKGSSSISVLQSPFAWLDCTQINVSRKPLNDVRVRQALRMAVDTTEIIQKGVFGAGTPSGPIATGFGDWYLDPKTLPYLTPDIAGAKKLLAEAGYSGEKIVINCSPQYPDFVANATVMQAAFKQIGVNAEIQQMEWGAFVAASNKFDFDMANTAFTFRPDPDGYIYAYFDTHGNLNAGGYGTPQLDAQIEKARSITDPAQRKQLYDEIQQTLLHDLPTYWWYDKYNIEALSTKLKGYVQSFTGRRLFLEKSWLSS